MLATSEHGQLFKQIIYCVGGTNPKVILQHEFKD